jgi:hypothetical protein
MGGRKWRWAGWTEARGEKKTTRGVALFLSAKKPVYAHPPRSNHTPHSAAPAAARRPSVAVAAATTTADAPGVALAKSGNSFAAVKDIEAIQEVLPHRCVLVLFWCVERKERESVRVCVHADQSRTAKPKKNKYRHLKNATLPFFPFPASPSCWSTASSTSSPNSTPWATKT